MKPSAIRNFLVAALALVCAGALSAPAQADQVPVAGENYQLVSPPQPTHSGNKIEVLELFWYGCPHCFHFEPYLLKWLANKPADVEFRRMPAVFAKTWVPAARAFYTAKALGILHKVHEDIFNAIHVKDEQLMTEAEWAKFFEAHGVDKATFEKTYESFAVDAKVKQAAYMTRQYGITGVPSIVVNGKYYTSGGMTGSYPQMLKVVDYLVDKEMQESTKQH